MQFLNYINESNRRTPILLDKLKDILTKECKKNLKATLAGNVLYRGVKSDMNDPVFLGDSNKGKARESGNTQNYYTLFLDNDISWKSYPKRSRSFICSTDLQAAGAFGTPLVVIPFDSTKMGICPTGDIWNSFEKINRISLWTLNSILKDDFRLLEKYSSWEKLKEDLNKKAEIFDFSKEYYWKEKKFFEYYVEKKKEYPELLFTDYMSIQFDPDKNRFRLINNLKELSSFKGNDDLEGNEIWFSGKCVFIEYDYFFEDLQDDLKYW